MELDCFAVYIDQYELKRMALVYILTNNFLSV